MGIIRKCNNHSFEERARAVWKEESECRRPRRPSVEMQCTKDGPCSYLPSPPPLSSVHRRMDRNFVRPHVMFEIMNVRSSGEREGGRAESKISGRYEIIARLKI